MALDITAQDIIIDETAGLTDDDINPAVAPYNTNTTLQYLETLGSPIETAYKADFVQATADAGETITSIVLTQDSFGHPFSETVGVLSDIQTVDGNYVWLFQDPNNADVVIGVIGTDDPTAEPDPATAPLAFSFALDPTSNTNADLYLVQYVALLNPDPTQPDNDLINLQDKVFASVSGTTVVNFSQLGDAPSGHNNWYILDADVASSQKILVTAHDNGVQAEVNVSTQGLGVASQDVRFGRELQIDLINGGTQSAGKNFTDTPLAPDYGSHIETVSSAGFSVSQSTPTGTVADIEIHAYNNDDNAEGAALPGDDNDTEINITGVTFKLNGVTMTASDLGITVDLTGSGLILQDVGEGVTVDFTTAGGVGGTFDRFTIKNIDTEKDFFDVKEVHFGGETTNAHNEEVGSFINFDDDGPTAGLTEESATVLHDETAGVDPASDDQPLASLPGAFSGLGTAIGWAASASAVVTPSSSFGADGPGTETLSLDVSGANADSGFDSLDGHNILLNVEGWLVVGRVDADDSGTVDSNDAVAIAISIDQNGILSIAQYIAIAHSNTLDPDDVQTMNDGALLAKVTATDGDDDSDSTSIAIGDKVQIRDDGPSITASGNEPTLTVDETSLGNNAADFSVAFTPSAGTDGDAIVYTLGIDQVTNVSGLTDTLTGQSVLLFVEGGEVVGRAGSAAGAVVFTVSVDADGNVTLDQQRAIIHSPETGPDQAATLAADNLVTLTATITDGDGDQAENSVNIGTSLIFKDDAPTITVPFDGDQNAGNGTGTHETLANTLNASATGAFGYDIGADAHPAAYYDATHSDFVDQNGGLAGVQIGLTGTVSGVNPAPTALLSQEVTLASESATSATFNFTFTYDKDPAAGDQPGTASGTLVFDKVNATYTITLTDPLEGFSFDVIHTAELLSKQPTSNSGHPPIVLEKLQADDPTTPVDEDFYVQFTGNLVDKTHPFSLTGNGEGSSTDTSFNSLPTAGTHDMVSNTHETWVSATQSTNGVAGDTIQKGELLTLRFFNDNVGIATEALQTAQNTATAGTMAIKFDGIGNSEDLMLILDLTDGTNSITKAIYVPNSAIFRTGQVPSPYSGEFKLDNNDGLVVIEQNDYNTGSEHYVIKGVQIMQSGNGITGTAITLNGATGSGGASTGTHIFDPVDNDVLKITDIGFTSTVSQTPDAHLNFAFQVADADGDVTPTSPDMAHILVDIA
ncbi:DUF5801 repeats-in-toxin domain-containing protein [Mesorhizobium sp. RCC_202]|uniref:DUF5801 repeats-in-toxin domain-containing protein n=1 Tax=Mesorhizobium sp. RCC_202 TaxID=3239222 RepID=UPI0035268D28